MENLIKKIKTDGLKLAELIPYATMRRSDGN